MGNEDYYLDKNDPIYLDALNGEVDKYVPMFPDRVFDKILEEDLGFIDKKFDKREGSVIYDALAPMAIEVSLLYSYLDFLFKNSYASTSNRYWLIQRAKERGISPYPASSSTIIGKFDVEISIGDRFSVDNINFIATKELETFEEGFFFYELKCEEVGVIGNIEGGSLVPIQTIRGLKVAEVYKLAILGEEEEDTELFRGRYFETIKNNAYGGNIADYKMKVRAIEGVGLVKVIPVWKGGGTVLVIITDPEYNPATHELVAKVQEILDPVPFRQQGVGVAPIGHLVTVKSAVLKEVNITCDLVIANNKTIEEIKTEIVNRLESYLNYMRSKWANYFADSTTKELYLKNDIRIAKVMSIVLNVDGVLDFNNISFAESAEKVLILNREEIPVLGTVTVNGQ